MRNDDTPMMKAITAALDNGVLKTDVKGDAAALLRAGKSVERLGARLKNVCAAAVAVPEPAGQQALSALADCERTLRRIAKRAAVVEGFERFEIRQINGPAVEFAGRLLCWATLPENRAGLSILCELYETAGGALVAVSASNLADGSGHEDERATVIPLSDDVQAMRFAAMDAFGWRTEAKKMVRTALGWDLRVEVE